MQNNKNSVFKSSSYYCVINTIAISSLLLVVTGCNSSIKEAKPTETNDSPISDNSALSDKTEIKPAKVVPISTTDIEKLVQSVNSVDSNIKYIKVAESGLPAFEINNLMRNFDNLNKYGSYSGGKITNEFTRTNDFKDALKENGSLENILKKLNFTPTDVGVLLGSEFNLVGADYSGAFNKGKFNSIFRSYESNNGKRFEINEMYFTPENNYSLQIYIESLNLYLAGHPATLQSLKNSENKEVYNLDFNVNQRVFSISSEGLRYPKFLKTSIKIAKSAEKNY